MFFNTVTVTKYNYFSFLRSDVITSNAAAMQWTVTERRKNHQTHIRLQNVCRHLAWLGFFVYKQINSFTPRRWISARPEWEFKSLPEYNEMFLWSGCVNTWNPISTFYRDSDKHKSVYKSKLKEHRTLNLTCLHGFFHEEANVHFWSMSFFLT